MTARIVDNLALTEVEQHFFNPRSRVVEGSYRTRLPAAAIIRSFHVGKPGSMMEGKIVPRSRKGGGVTGQAVLEWAAPDRYVATIYPIGPGATVVVRLTYVQWLHNRRGRRRYVYPMGGGLAPKLGEFSIEVNVRQARAHALKAGLSAKREKDWIIVRRSDFVPRADFVLELLDKEARNPPPTLARARAAAKGKPAYAALTLMPEMIPAFVKKGLSAKQPIKLVIVADVSAGSGTAELTLTRTVVDAILRQLHPTDEVALLTASVDARPLGKGKPLARATLKRREALLGALARIQPGGGTHLEQALLAASRLLPKGLGSVIYVGDGRPTLGTLAPGLLRDRLGKRLTPPRIFAVGIGPRADHGLLKAITDGLGFAVRVPDVKAGPRAALRIVAHAARPTLRAVTVDLGPEMDRLYPRRPVTIEAGTVLQVLGRLRGKPPKRVTLRGLLQGRPFKATLKLKNTKVQDYQDLRRRWALARIHDLLRRGAGREAVAEVGVRYAVVTPFTGMVVGASSSLKWYRSRLPADPAGTFVPEALRGGPPLKIRTIALEPGWSTLPGRAQPLARLYQRALHAKLWTAVRASFDRKAASRPDLSGQLVLEIEVNPDGAVHKVTHQTDQSTLKDPDVLADVLRLVQAVRLPATPTGERFTFTHIFRFVPQDISDVPSRCLRKDGTRKRSPESYKYLEVRRALWRERLLRNRSPVGAHKLWREALACGEIRLDTDARALLLLSLKLLRTTRAQVDYYLRMQSELPWVRWFLRREILRRVRTLNDVAIVRGGLALDGGLDHALLKKMLEKAKTDKKKIEVIRKFLALSPRSLTLRVMLLHLLERTKQADEAERLAWTLRADPAVDAGIREQVGEFFLRRGAHDEARRAFSEIVEFAPYDPWARRRLGDLLMAQADRAQREKGDGPRRARRLFGDAYREYETLAWLMPNDPSVLLLMANAAAGMRRLDWALRLQERVAETAEVGSTSNGPAAWARLLTSVRLARLRQASRADKNKLARIKARGRRAGVYTWSKDLSLLLTFTHPGARLQLRLRYPGHEKPTGVALQGDPVGIQGIRLMRSAIWGPLAQPAQADKRARRRREKDLSKVPLYIEVRTADTSPDRATTYHGELLLLWLEGKKDERVEPHKIVLDGKTKAVAFLLHPDGKIEATKVFKPKKKKEREETD